MVGIVEGIAPLWMVSRI